MKFKLPTPPPASPPLSSSDLLADVAQYLASDGSFGLYDARTMIDVRERLFVAVGGAPVVAAARKRIIDGLTANDKVSHGHPTTKKETI